MTGNTLIYRGSLKSCNYRCSYCPFSKRRTSARELEQDRAQWFSFLQSFPGQAAASGIRALLIAPYGEALIHPWYWEGLAHISACQNIDAVGAQTNLSFPLESSLSRFTEHGGIQKKLRLWATFHPEMTTAEAFANQCRRLFAAGISLCAGAVGVPKHKNLIQTLRRILPAEIYLWINKMDGLGRPYTDEEQSAFLQIDPYFLRELAPVPSDKAQCAGRLFLEGNGSTRTCNISPPLPARSKIPDIPVPLPEPSCSRRLCSCYLAYGGRDNFLNRILFGPYPLFRIPRRPKAVFLDIEGTLLVQQKPGRPAQIPKNILAGIKALSLENIPLYFATTLPLREACKRCRPVWDLFSGGIFAGGAHIVQNTQNRELYYYLDQTDLSKLSALEQNLHFCTLTYAHQGRPYKITLHRARHNPWRPEEIQALEQTIPWLRSPNIRYFTEQNCLQILSAKADKAAGVRTVCSWLNISPREAAAAGDAPEEAGMLKLSREPPYHHLST